MRLTNSMILISEVRFQKFNITKLTSGIVFMSASSLPKCARCEKLGATNKCSRCKSASYCSRTCQSADWKTHKISCVSIVPATASASAAPVAHVRGPYSRYTLQQSDVPSALSKFTYSPSADDKDTNLIVFLGGLGDTHTNFAQFARSLNLPQSATLVLQGPLPIPFDDMHGGAWYPAFEDDGECALHSARHCFICEVRL